MTEDQEYHIIAKILRSRQTRLLNDFISKLRKPILRYNNEEWTIVGHKYVLPNDQLEVLNRLIVTLKFNILDVQTMVIIGEKNQIFKEQVISEISNYRKYL